MAAEYVDDVPYVRFFLGDLAPSQLRLVAGLNGLTPPPAFDFDYAEIGCAHADTLVALAAAHPDSRFIGVDLSNDHIASAKRLARGAAIDNVGFYARDVADLTADDVPPLDYVVAHGVLSWISPDKRRALFEFASKALKPGGLFFVSYNAMPGWGAVEPLRQLLLFPGTTAAAADLPTVDRARLGLEFAQLLERAGADYFAKNPSASEMLRVMTKAGLAYVAHEYLHEHWTPMYFAKVAWEAASHGLSFVGALPAHVNLRETAIPESLDPILGKIADRVTFESLKDIANNEFFRRDVFVKGAAAPSAQIADDYLDATLWGTLGGGALEPSARLPHRTIDLSSPGIAVLFDIIAAGGATGAELAAHPSVHEATMFSEGVRQALLRLVLTERVLPFRAKPPPRKVDGDGRFVVPNAYNQTTIRRGPSDAPRVLISPAAGTGFSISALEALTLRMFTEVPRDGMEAAVRDLVGRSVMRIRSGDHVIEDRDEQARTILSVIAEIRGERLRKLVELGILAPAD